MRMLKFLDIKRKLFLGFFRYCHCTLWSESDLLFIMSVTIHTDLGDIKLELYCDRPTKTCENFLALCACGYYNGCHFHRNMKSFIVQTGDKTNTGKGGVSIWKKKFTDEIFDDLRHSKRGIVSMANSGLT